MTVGGMAVGIGKGLREPVSPYRLATFFGADLNAVNADNWGAVPVIVDPLTTLDLSTLTINHEAIVALCGLSNITAADSIVFKWVRNRDGAVLYTYTFQVPSPSASGYAAWAWYYSYSYIGYVSWELSENGAYHVEISAGGQTLTIAFTVTGIPAAEATGGTLWDTLLASIISYFTEIANEIAAWIYAVGGQAYDLIKPAIDAVWSWINSAAGYIIQEVNTLFAPVWGWIQGVINTTTATIQGWGITFWYWLSDVGRNITTTLTSYLSASFEWLGGMFSGLFAALGQYYSTMMSFLSSFLADIGKRLSDINKWFSNEFIDPFLDWLLQFPGKFMESLNTMISAIWNRIETWMTHRSPGLIDFLENLLYGILQSIGNIQDFLTQKVADVLLAVDPEWPTRPFIIQWLELWGVSIAALLGGLILAGVAPALLAIAKSIGAMLLEFSPGVGVFGEALLPRIGGWFIIHMIPLIGSGTVLTLAATGALTPIVHNLITPAIVGIFDWFEKRGPVAPMSGGDISGGITKLAEFTITGLAAMTLGGEMLSPLKQLGLGNISAIMFDLINYKVLTAAFMGVLAFVYIQKPLTYYYNKVARPNLPDERHLASMLEDRVISSADYRENMTWQGYPDTWIEKIEDTLFRPMTPYMLRSLAEAGLLDDDLLDHALNHAGYDDISKVAIKKMMNTLASGSLAAVSTSTAMSRYQEGFDDEASLRQNLSALGVADSMLDRYVFAAQLKYLTDYQADLKSFFIDEYHRRVIEEPEFRTQLSQQGFAPIRLDLLVAQQRIKRLAAAPPADDPAIAVQFDTIRDRRKKNLISRADEITQLVAIGKEMSYASAVADNDDVAMTPTGAVAPSAPLKPYETDAGKIEVDTTRRLRRQRQISDADEMKALTALLMPTELARAIVDNDTLRLSKAATSG